MPAGPVLIAAMQNLVSSCTVLSAITDMPGPHFSHELIAALQAMALGCAVRSDISANNLIPSCHCSTCQER